MHRKKNVEADYGNPNIYNTIDDIKDNRKLENVYDEISKGLANLKPEANLQNRVSLGSGYDRLDFNRVHSELRPEYHSTHTLRSTRWVPIDLLTCLIPLIL